MKIEWILTRRSSNYMKVNNDSSKEGLGYQCHPSPGEPQMIELDQIVRGRIFEGGAHTSFVWLYFHIKNLVSQSGWQILRLNYF